MRRKSKHNENNQQQKYSKSLRSTCSAAGCVCGIYQKKKNKHTIYTKRNIQ